jgi:hypothetical protein
MIVFATRRAKNHEIFNRIPGFSSPESIAARRQKRLSGFQGNGYQFHYHTQLDATAQSW